MSVVLSIGVSPGARSASRALLYFRFVRARGVPVRESPTLQELGNGLHREMLIVPAKG